MTLITFIAIIERWTLYIEFLFLISNLETIHYTNHVIFLRALKILQFIERYKVVCIGIDSLLVFKKHCNVFLRYII